MDLLGDDCQGGQSVTITAVYRFDDDHTNHSPSSSTKPEWELAPEIDQTFSEESRMDFIKFGKKLDQRDRTDGVEFLRALQVGNEVRVWSGGISHGMVDGTGNVAMIEGVEVSVFWEI